MNANVRVEVIKAILDAEDIEGSLRMGAPPDEYEHVAPSNAPGVAEQILRTKGNPTMKRDVVCGMPVDPAKAVEMILYKGQPYFFCSKSCKAKFEADPAQYVK